VELYSFQPFEIYEQLLQGNTFRSAPAICNPQSEEFEDTWKRAYDWLMGEMDRRCPVSRPAGVTYPVWAWHWWGGPNRRKPDLRSSRHYAETSPWVLLSLEVPEGEVLLSEYHAWHHVLNDWFLAPETEVTAFEARCKARDLSPFRNRPLPDVELREELENTWHQIFDLEKIPALLEYEREESYVQATFWELRPEFVRKAVWFEKKGRSRTLELPAAPLKTAA
jgi:hypothetical protein